MPSSQKPFKTYRQQLSILRKRNLEIKDGSRAIKILRREGYYNIINGYKEIFLDIAMSRQMGDDYYKQGTTFEHIFSVYDFDRSTRSILIKYILKFETALKTKIAYVFSERFSQNFSYLDINNFDASDPQKVTRLISRISNVITNNSQQQDQGGQIFHYLDKYKELPLWVLVNKMTLGEAYHFFDSLQNPMKDNIIDEFISEYDKEYGLSLIYSVNNRVACFSSMLRFINKFRNICAHDERLFNTLIKDNKGRIPRISLFHKQAPIAFKSRLFDCLLILGFFLSKKDYIRLLIQLSAELDSLSKKLPQRFFNDVLIQMGFSRNWKNDLKLP